MLAIQSSFAQFFNLKGLPLTNGSLYIGVVNTNPVTNPITVYWDEDGTQPAAQPIKTLNGTPVRDGTPAQVFVPGDYSITVLDPNGSLIYNLPTSASDAFTLLSSSIFPTQAAAAGSDIDASVNFVTTAGLLSPGDGGGQIYMSVPLSGPVQPYQFTSNGGTRVWQISPMTVKLEQFGSVIQGNDIYPAMLAALAYANAVGYLALELPPGHYTCSHICSISLAVNQNTGLTVKGDGSASTFIELLSGSTGFISVSLTTADTAQHSLKFEGFTVFTNTTVAGAGILCNFPVGGASVSNQVVVEDVCVQGALSGTATYTAYIRSGLNFAGVIEPYINNFVFSGAASQPNPTYATGDSEFLANTGVTLTNVKGGTIVNSRIKNCTIGIYNAWTSTPGGNKFRVANTMIYQVQDGIEYIRVVNSGGLIAGEQGLWITNCCITYRDAGITLTGVSYAWCDDNLFYAVGGANALNNLATDITMADVAQIYCTNNVHAGANGGNRTAYNINTADLNSNNIFMKGAAIPQSVAMTNVVTLVGNPQVIGSSYTVYLIDPKVFGDGSALTGALWGGSGAQRGRTIYSDNMRTSVALVNNPQNIPNSTQTVVKMDTINEDDLSLFSATAGTMTIAAGSGIKRIRFWVSIGWANNNAGYTEITVGRNGNPKVAGSLFDLTSAPPNGGAVQQSAVSPWVTTTDGDVWSLYVFQDSGGTLAVENAVTTVWVAEVG